MDAARLAVRHREQAPARRRAERRLYQWASTGDTATLTLLAAVTAVLQIGFLALLGLTLARLVEGEGQWPLLSQALIAMAALALARALLQGVLSRRARGAGLAVVTGLRRHLMRRAMRPGWRLRHGPGAGALAMRLGPELDSIAPWYGRYLPALLLALLQPLLILAVVFPLDWLAGVLLLVAGPLIPLFMALIGMGVAVLAEEQHRRLALLGDHFLDRLRALPLLRLLDRTDAAADEVEEAAHGWRRAAMRVLRVAFLSSAVLEFFAAVAIATVAIYVGMALLGFHEFGPAPEMTLASGLIILLLAPEFFAPLRQLGQRYHDRAEALAAMVALEPHLAFGPEPEPEKETPQPDHWISPPAVELRGLRLAPGGNTTAPLPGPLDLSIKAGEWIAFTGPSGCGKTTLADTLLGLLPAADGEIRIEGRPLASIPEAEVRANAGWLGQESTLLSASLRTSLAPGEKTVDEETLWEAIRGADLEEVVRALPRGLETRLGEDGAGLSGGERRRLALARCLYRRPRMLVLDEPTAGLDAATEARILQCLRALRGHCTLLMFTHSGAAAAAADGVFSLAGGGREGAP